MSSWTPLAGMQVVEACQRLVGPLAGWHLGLLGAEVTKIEPPAGDVARGWGAVFDLVNARKRCAALDLAVHNERNTLEELCARADVVLADATWSEEPALAGCRRHTARTRAVVIVDDRAVPGGFGSSETLVQAAMAVTPYIGDPAGPPERLGADLASASGATTTVQAALAGLLEEDGAPPLIARIAADRAVAALKTIHWAARSDPDRWTGYHVRAISRAPDRGYRVRDGFVTLDFLPDQRAAWRNMCTDLGLDEFAVEVENDWYSTVGMEDRIDWARPQYERALARFTRAEAVALIRRHGGWSVPFQSPSEMLNHPQARLYASAWLAGGKAQVRLPWRIDNQPQATHLPAAAPAVGAHTREALAALPARTTHRRGEVRRALPLTGVRVVNFGVGGVAPFAASQLAQLGATVVKIEAPNEFIMYTLPPWRGLTTTYAALNANCRSVKLNLKDETDNALAWRLVETADVMLENFRSGAIDRMGFGFDAVAARNPRIIFCSSSGFGREGEMAGLPCTDPHIQAFSGFAALNGRTQPGERARYYGMVDLYTAQRICEAVVAALVARRRQVRPQYVEMTMLGAATSMLLTQLASHLGGEPMPTPDTARHTAPDGVYPTADRPIAITVECDTQYGAFCSALERDDLAADARFATAPARLANMAALDAEVARTLGGAPSDWWLVALRRAGVPCARVHLDHEVTSHVETWRRGNLREITVAGAGTLQAAAPPWSFEGIAQVGGHAPRPGQDTDLLRRGADSFWHALEQEGR